MSHRRPLALAAAAACAALAVAAASPAAALTTSTGLGTAPAPNPASGLQVLRSGEAGQQTLFTSEAHPDPLIQTDTTIEPSIAVDPADPLHVVTGYQMGRDDAGGDISNGFATSFDGGATWTDGTVPGLTSFDPSSPKSPYTRASDAVVAFGPPDAAEGGKSVVYYSSLVFDPTGTNTRSAIVNSTSHDGGLTWDAPTIVQDDNGAGLNDKNWVVVDRSNAPGHHLGRVYVVWDRVAGVIAKYSDDQGATWVGPPSPLYTPNVYAGQGIGSLPVILPGGGLAVTFLTATPVTVPTGDELAEAQKGISKIVVAVAPQAGSTSGRLPLVFEPLRTVTTFQGGDVRGQRAGGLVSSDVDPATGRFYVTYEDSATHRTDGRNDVVLASTPDVTVQSPPFTEVRVNAGPPDDQVDRYDPSVAVGPGPTVRVTWRQRQETDSADVTTYSTRVSTWAAQSTDGGMTFAPALRIDRDINDVRFGAFSRGGTFQGDYDQLATATDGTTYVVHCEAVQLDPAETPPATPSATTVHHQRTWVTVLRPADAAPALPELRQPALGLLAVLAPASALMVVLARRRRQTAGS